MIYQLVFGEGHATPVVNCAFSSRDAAETALSDRRANGTAFPGERVAEFNSHRRPGRELEDTPASHLRNALQISLLLAGEIDQMIGNPEYQDTAKKSLQGIDKRIRAALAQLEGSVFWSR